MADVVTTGDISLTPAFRQERGRLCVNAIYNEEKVELYGSMPISELGLQLRDALFSMERWLPRDVRFKVS